MGTDSQGKEPDDPARRSKLEIATLALTALSAVGLVGAILFGAVSDPEEGNAIEVAFIAWTQLSLLLCLFVGVFSWIRGARTRNRGTARAGQIAVGYMVLTSFVVIIAVYGQGTG